MRKPTARKLAVPAVIVAAWMSVTSCQAIAAEPPHVVQAAFNADPGWEGFRNRQAADKPQIVRQDFGYRKTNRAGGQKAGEIGGRVQRSPRAAFYALPIEPRSLDEKLSASGKLAVPAADGGSGAMIGWFAAPPPSWRTPNSVAFRIDGNGGTFWMFYEYGTRNWQTGGGGAFEGDQYQTTTTPPFPADGKVHAWSLDYDPAGADGRGEITFRIDDRVYKQPLAEGHRADGAKLDHFGIWNVQVPGADLELYLDDLTIDGREYSFDDDPRWQAVGTPAEFPERFIRPHHDFGFSHTRHAGGAAGEIGGVVFRDERPAYYAAKSRPLSLDDELTASGRFTLLQAASDSGVYLGWFDSTTKQQNETPEYVARQRNYLALVIEGPSRIGHYVRPAYGTRDGHGVVARETSADGSTWTIVHPDAVQHTFSMRYRPEAAEGNGRVELAVDGRTQHFDLKPGDRQRGAAFDRFGLFNLQSGGHGVEIYLDDVRYSAR